MHPSLDPINSGPVVHASAAYELVCAARWAGFRHFAEFDLLETDDQARIVAEYRVAMRKQAVLQDLQRLR